MNGCTHEEVEWYEEEIENWYGDNYIETKTRTVSLSEDVDLHRYRCSRCGEIGYYSGAAKDFYENGVLCAVKGLR